MTATEQQIRTLIADHLLLNEDEIVPDADFKQDLGADSMDVVELAMLLEEMFDIEISDTAAEKIHTVREAVDYVAAQQRSR